MNSSVNFYVSNNWWLENDSCWSCTLLNNLCERYNLWKFVILNFYLKFVNFKANVKPLYYTTLAIYFISQNVVMVSFSLFNFACLFSDQKSTNFRRMIFASFSGISNVTTVVYEEFTNISKQIASSPLRKKNDQRCMTCVCDRTFNHLLLYYETISTILLMVLKFSDT